MKKILVLILVFFSFIYAQNDKKVIANDLKHILVLPLREMDLEEIKNILKVYMNHKNILAIKFYNEFNTDNKPIYFFKKEGFDLNTADIQTVKIQDVEYNHYLGKVVIYFYTPKMKILLTKKEKEYIKNHVIKVNVTTTWPPFYYKEDGKLVGIAIDYWKLIAKKLHLKYKFVISKTFPEVLENIKTGKTDINIATTKTENKKYALFTYPYETFKIGIAVKKSQLFVNDIKLLEGRRVAVGREYSSYYLLKKHYPKIKWIYVDNTSEGLELLEKNKVFAVVDVTPVLNFLRNYEDYKGIAVHSSNIKFPLEIMINNKEKILQNILNKAVLTITHDDRLNIYKKWIEKNKRIVDNRMIKKIVTIFVAIILIGLLIGFIGLYAYIRELKLLKEIKELNETLEERVKEEVEKNKKHQLMLIQQNRLAQLGEMISMIAHQWRQPLNYISLLGQTIVFKYKMNVLTKDDILEFDKKLKAQVNYMSETIDNFRNFFKPNKEKEEFSINERIKYALSLLEAVFKRYEIEVEFNEDGEYKIVGYPNEFGQAIINILSNAKDVLIDKDERKIIINLTSNDNEIILSIEDTGGGIDESIIDKIFDPYFSTKDEKNGTGIGLYMAKIIIEKNMKGTLLAENGEKGARFIIKFNKN